MRNESRSHVPSLRVQRSDVLMGARFELARARIAWSDDRESEGWGRDADLQLAGLKAVAEAVERHACECLPGTAVEAAATALPSWVDPGTLVRYEDAQHGAYGFPFVRFSPSEPRWWLPAMQADGAGSTFVLAECACLAPAFDIAYRARRVTSATTSGCATGGSVEEALERATLELVERDAFMRHWLMQTPGFALQSLPGWARERLAALENAGCRAGIQWLALGAQPVLLAWAQHEALAFTAVGSACGFDAEPALAAALSELETMALARLEGVPGVAITPQQVQSPADHGALYATQEHFRDADALLNTCESRGFAQFSAALPARGSQLYAALRERGHSVFWVDLTVPEAASLVHGMPLHTVRALAPGLVPLAFGYGRQPLGMLGAIAPGGRRLHPFC